MYLTVAGQGIPCWRAQVVNAASRANSTVSCSSDVAVEAVPGRVTVPASGIHICGHVYAGDRCAGCGVSTGIACSISPHRSPPRPAQPRRGRPLPSHISFPCSVPSPAHLGYKQICLSYPLIAVQPVGHPDATFMEPTSLLFFSRFSSCDAVLCSHVTESVHWTRIWSYPAKDPLNTTFSSALRITEASTNWQAIVILR